MPKYIKIFQLFVFLVSWQHATFGQSNFYGISSLFDDTPIEWKIFATDSSDQAFESSVRAKWPHKELWIEWQIDHLDYYWDLFLRYPTNPPHWFLDTENGSISIKQKWRSDITEWVITFDRKKIKWTSEYKTDLSSWYFDDKNLGVFEMWATWEGDARDWEINDQAPNVPDEVKLAAMFITVYITNPH